MEEEIKYMLEQEMETIESKFAHLSWLAKKLNITDKDKLKETLEFARLFDECNKNGWIELNS